MPQVDLKYSNDIEVALLKKPHRDKLFMQICLKKLEETVMPFIPKHCYYAIDLFFSGDYYVSLQK